jgi:hypothetical protein
MAAAKDGAVCRRRTVQRRQFLIGVYVHAAGFSARRRIAR